MSRRPLSTMARNTRRPMRPKPLIATRMAMLAVSQQSSPPQPWGGRSVLRLQRLFRGRSDGLRRQAEMLVHILIRSAGAETMHSDKAAMRPDIAVPALAHA